MSDAWPFSPPKKILLATDLSARSDRALDRAVQLARQWNSILIVVHALEKPPLNPPWWSQLEETPSWRRPPDPAKEIEEQIRRELSGKVFQVCWVFGAPVLAMPPPCSRPIPSVRAGHASRRGSVDAVGG